MKSKPLGMLRRLAGALGAAPEGTVSGWQPAGQSYPRLDKLDSGSLASRSGLYLLWHLGVRPRWLRVGFAADLGLALDEVSTRPEVTSLGVHGGLYVSWYFCPAQAASGFVNYLVPRLQPALQVLALDGDSPIDLTAAARACDLPPGTAAIWSMAESNADRR